MNRKQMEHSNRGRFCNTIVSVALVHTSIQAISEGRHEEFSRPMIQSEHSCKGALKPVAQFSPGAGKGWFLREVMCL